MLRSVLGILFLVTVLSCGGSNTNGGNSDDPNTPGTQAPSITTHPQNQTVTAGQTATFSVMATGTAPLSYQWNWNGSPITGATSSSYITPVTTTADDGASFTVTVTNTAGNVKSNAAILTVNAAPASVITFTTEGASFTPVIAVQGSPEILWTWDDGTTSNAVAPTKNFGSTDTRTNTLLVNPWSALRRINIGYDAGDGGSYSLEMVPDQHVSSVQGLEVVAPYLEQWCSSYNDLTSLNFSNFTQLDTIECFLSGSLTSVNLANTPALKRACFEDCDLSSLDLSQSPALEDLRGAVNNYPTIQFGTIGSHVWHICVRDNPQMTSHTLFSDMSQFPNISELFIWNDNQTGTLRIPASHPTSYVSFLGDDNHYTSLNLSGALQNPNNLGTVSFVNNQLTAVDITGCAQINDLNLSNNQLSSSQLDTLLATLDALGRNSDNTSPSVPLRVDIHGNQTPGTTGYDHAVNLAAKGWTIIAEGWTVTPPPPADTGEASIDFSTTGDTTTMRCDFMGASTATWHWSDGTTSTATSAGSITKSGLGTGNHAHHLIVSNGAALTRFGASTGGGNGHLVSISDFTNSPTLTILYVYNEPALVSLGHTNQTKLKEYHLMSTGLSTTAMDHVFADAVLSGMTNGILYCANMGTSASDGDRATLVTRGWQLY